MAMFEQLIIPVMSGWLIITNLCICKCYCMFHISARHLLLAKVVAVYSVDINSVILGLYVCMLRSSIFNWPFITHILAWSACLK